MNSSPTPGLIPLNDCVLVELKQSTRNVSIKESKYDTRTEGVVIAVPEKPVVQLAYTKDLDVKWLVGKHIFFEEFKEGARIKRGTKVYSFIKIEDIRGYEDVKAS